MREKIHVRRRLVFAILALTVGSMEKASAQDGEAPNFVVCADPGNLPYSNQAGEGFENKIAQLLAADLGKNLQYFWFAEHKNFLRRTLSAGLCDVVISVPSALTMVTTTRPYFTSTYVAVMRADDSRGFSSFDDAWLKDARIGLQLVGNEGVTTPPAVAISRRGFNEHITPFPMWAEDNSANPQGQIIEAVADGRIDIAFVWGPFAGYFGRKFGDRLAIKPILQDSQSPDLMFAYPMAIGVRKDAAVLRDKLQSALDRNQEKIAVILNDAGIPTIDQSSVPGSSGPEIKPSVQ